MGLDPYNLARFLVPQNAPNTQANYKQALSQIKAGKKIGHWIWWIFPVLVGISTSANGTKYGLTSLAEARAYLAHPILGPRLIECVSELCGLASRDILAIMSSNVDVQKLQSCLTLFIRADPKEEVSGFFQMALDEFYATPGATKQKFVGRFHAATDVKLLLERLSGDGA